MSGVGKAKPKEKGPRLPPQAQDSESVANLAEEAVRKQLGGGEVTGGGGKPDTPNTRKLKAHRRMKEAQVFENDLSEMDEISHLNAQRAKIANLLQGMKKQVDESDGK